MNTPQNLIGVKSRHLWIDAAKGGGILLVLLAHTNLAPAGLNPHPGNILSYLYYLMASYMPLFFVLSGYTFKDKTNILQLRARQLFIPYAIWCIIYFLLFVTSAICNNQIYPLYWCKLLAGCIYSRIDLISPYIAQRYPIQLPGAGPLWFLTALFVSYALYLPIHRLTGRKKFILIIVYLILALAFHQCPFLLPWSADTAFAGALFILCGQFLKTSGIINSLTIKSILIALAILPFYVWSVNINGGSGGMCERYYGHLGWYATVIFIFMGASGSYLWCILCQILERCNLVKIFSKIGEHTLLILCSHMFFYILVAKCAKQLLNCKPNLHYIEPYIFIIQLTAALAFVFIWDNIKKRWSTKHRFLTFRVTNG